MISPFYIVHHFFFVALQWGSLFALTWIGRNLIEETSDVQPRKPEQLTLTPASLTDWELLGGDICQTPSKEDVPVAETAPKFCNAHEIRLMLKKNPTARLCVFLLALLACSKTVNVCTLHLL
jgi:hypothetical protein